MIVWLDRNAASAFAIDGIWELHCWPAIRQITKHIYRRRAE